MPAIAASGRGRLWRQLSRRLAIPRRCPPNTPPGTPSGGSIQYSNILEYFSPLRISYVVSEFAQKKFSDQSRGHPFASADCKVLERRASTAVRCGIVGI